MNNPMFGNMPQMNPLQVAQQLRANPALIQRAGLRIPQNLTDPNAIIQHLMNTGQVTQQRYNQAVQFAQQQFRK